MGSVWGERMIHHWVVLADASHVRVLSADELLNHFDVVEEFGPSTQKMHSSAQDAHTASTDVAHAKFAVEVAHALLDGLNQKKYERVIIAAPPRFLGLLRGELSPRVAGHVVAEIHHDYVHTPLHQLGDLLKAQLPVA